MCARPSLALGNSVKFGGADCRLLQPCISPVQEEKVNEKEMVKCLDKQQKSMSRSIFHQLLACLAFETSHI